MKLKVLDTILLCLTQGISPQFVQSEVNQSYTPQIAMRADNLVDGFSDTTTFSQLGKSVDAVAGFTPNLLVEDSIPILILKDTVTTPTTSYSVVETEIARLPQSEYMFADNPRYSFLGKTPYVETNVQVVPTVAMIALYGTTVALLHINQSNAWWKDQSGGWKIQDDIQYAKGLDKFGHVFSGYLWSAIANDLLVDCGFTKNTSAVLGTGLGIAYMMYVEVEDGFASNWGFSPTDAIANFVGAFYFISQQNVPFLQNFTPRWSYVPAHWSGSANINQRPITIIDDYNATSFWLACNVENILPSAAKPYWPDWLMISVGYGIRNYDVHDSQGNIVPITQRFMIGLDYDWVKIIPASSFGVLNYLRQGLSYVKLPAPTIEFGDEGFKFALFYPFAVVIPF